jgi:hypothetical protein
MQVLPQVLVGISAGLVFALGAIHLLYTFRGRKLLPRDSALLSSMKHIAPVISDQTTMWKAWIGFNASHSMGAMLFGLIYGYLSVFESDLLFGSMYLASVGFAMLAGLFLLGRRYWFWIPNLGISISLGCFVAGIVTSRL